MSADVWAAKVDAWTGCVFTVPGTQKLTAQMEWVATNTKGSWGSLIDSSQLTERYKLSHAHHTEDSAVVAVLSSLNIN
jgi:hypothetical protein